MGKEEITYEEFNDLYSSANINRESKSRIVRLAGHVARVGERRVVYRIMVGNPEGMIPLVSPRCRWTFRKWDGGPCTGCIWLRVGTGGGHLYTW